MFLCVCTQIINATYYWFENSTGFLSIYDTINWFILWIVLLDDFFGRSDTNLRGIILNKYNLILNSVMGVFEGKTILEPCERESGEANWGQTSSKQFCLLTILQLVAIYKNGLQFITSSGFQFSARRAWLWRFAIMKTNVFHEVLIFWITAYLSPKKYLL